jgi:hypothetical protein
MYREYVCSECARKVVATLIGARPGRTTFVNKCRGCEREFGQPWTATPDGDCDFPTILEAKPWPAEEPKPILTGSLSPAPVSVASFMLSASGGVILAAMSIYTLLHQLVHKAIMV